MTGSKYLKYAIGEIFLVVVGILIALSINNWNQKRLAGQEEDKLLENIRVDFQEAVRTFRALNSRRDESLENFGLLIAAGARPPGNTRYLDSLLAKTFFTPTYNGKSSSLSILINSGKINLISNDQLKSLLLKWPQQVEDMTEGEIDAKELTYNTWLPLITTYTSTNDWFKGQTYSDLLPFASRKTRVSKDYEGLFENRQFENTISLLEMLYVSGKRETGGLIGRAEEIIAIIDQELAED